MSLRNFCWNFFQICISYHGCGKFQIYGKLQFLEDAFSSQNIDSRYFYSYILPPPILKFGIKHVVKPLTLDCYAPFILIFHAGLRGLGSNNFGNSSYKEKTAGSARVFRVSSRYDYDIIEF